MLFLDLLGTRGVRTGAESEAHLGTVHAAMQRAREACFPPEAKPASGAAQWFSDNLAIGYRTGPGDPSVWLVQLIFETAYLHLAFLEKGLLARGAIARGGFYADDDFIYGPALERAVVLEHARAIYPRCVLDEASTATAAQALRSGDGGAPGSTWRRYLAQDRLGIVFVDYLAVLSDDPAGRGSDIESITRLHKQVIEDGLYRYDGDEHIEEKYRWLAGYHDFFVDAYMPQYDVRAAVSRRPSGFARFG